ncbi:proton-conducting transporter membrane subunit [Aquisalinus flavus]|uniref:Na(+)/H(+) antiporter subunit D n=1 Tax=Aquisalinus flavus TaxID=1526572 RepID=A0A8J2V663_9PROT|nr:proton-conducting transporter membrane subunit [Aquisalinus flavus]MBD0426269.1 Na(+)/H(+) antiporter subunit D [Aquisalinus flavus]UNE48160.1 Na(+)/H(+) antiporter subunit D [Aquisalinus flavus]GGD09292.1 Na(+)/H(+) antiporter subunit D [Aquisalinus flavus]
MSDLLAGLIQNPGMLLIVAGVIVALLPGRQLRAIAALAAIIGCYALLASYGTAPMDAPVLMGESTLFGLDLVSIRIDRLSVVFATLFFIAAGLNAIYGWLHASRMEASMGLIYAGAAIGGVLAGDLLTLFIFWELAALSSVFIVWGGGTHAAFKAGMRYLVIQVGSGMALMAGVALTVAATGETAFTAMSLTAEDGSLNIAALLIFIGFGVKAGFPLLHFWLPDAYPRASAVGAVMLSAFTTKMAIYALARGFPGEDILMLIGAVMAVAFIFFGAAASDLRRVLAYSLNSQLGFMVCGIGIGSELAINGAVAHAFASVIYKGMLFMAMGAVLTRAGTLRAAHLSGLYRAMPLTALVAFIGALTITGVPLFAGFVTKSMTISAAGYYEHMLVWLALIAATVGAVNNIGVRIFHDTFMGARSDAAKVSGDAPLPMLIAMALAAAICLVVGIQPTLLWSMLPFDYDYAAYTMDHLITQMQLILFAVLLFALARRFGLAARPRDGVLLDVDWLYRVPGRIALAGVVRGTAAAWHRLWWGIQAGVARLVKGLYDTHGPEGALARSWPVGFMALFTAVVLGLMLIVTFVAY